MSSNACHVDTVGATVGADELSLDIQNASEYAEPVANRRSDVHLEAEFKILTRIDMSCNLALHLSTEQIFSFESG